MSDQWREDFLPMTPKLVRRRYSKGRVLLTVCKNGYRKSGMWAARKADLWRTKLHCEELFASLMAFLIFVSVLHVVWPTNFQLLSWDVILKTKLYYLTCIYQWKIALSAEEWVNTWHAHEIQLPCLWMGCYTLEERQGVTYSVGLVCCQGRGVDWWVDVDDFLAMTGMKVKIKQELPGPLFIKTFDNLALTAKVSEELHSLSLYASLTPPHVNLDLWKTLLRLTCSRAAIVPQECHSMGARSGTDSRFLLSSRRAFSLVSGLESSLIHW